MSPFLAGAIVAAVHFAIMLAGIVVGSGPTFRRGEAGLPLTLYDRCLLGVLKVLSIPVLHLTARYPGLLNRTGWPREHLLLMGNRALSGIAAGRLVSMI